MTNTAIPLVLMPTTITDAMLTSCSIAEPAAGETAWISAASYEIGDYRIRTTTHRTYKCAVAHTGRTTLPEDDPTYWYDDGPTIKWAAFDALTSTAAEYTGTLTFVLHPGFFTAVCVEAAYGSQIDAVIKDQTGGTTIKTYTASLVGPWHGVADFYWGAARYSTKHIITDILCYPNAELTITITGAPGSPASPVSVGAIRIGRFMPLLIGDWGGTEHGASVKPVNFDYVDVRRDGSWRVTPGRKATDIAFTAKVPQEDADYAIGVIQSIQGATFIVATTATGYLALSNYGIVKAALMTYEDATHVKLSIDQQGLT